MPPTLHEVRARQQAISQFAKEQLLPRLSEWEQKSRSLFDVSEIQAVGRRALPFFLGGFFTPSIIKALKLSPVILSLFELLSLLAFAYGAWIVFPAVKNAVSRIQQLQLERLALQSKLKKDIIQYLDPSFQFLNQPLFPSRIYEDSGIFPQDYDRKSAEDQCRGQIGTTSFELTEVATYKKVIKRNSQGKAQITWEPLFKGLILVLEFNKRFQGKTIVETDALEKSYGVLGRSAQRLIQMGGKMDLVELENPQFEKRFKVRSTDPIEARYILTPKFMELLLSLDGLIGMGAQASFFEGKMVLAFPRGKPFFDIPLSSGSLIQSVENEAEDLLQMLDLIDHFELNSNLWKASTRKEAV
ncbi:MAG: DUF3137 domain-containing protein [Bdellovibrionales bacterium]|nr:DUF3137 domain-containing protein [Bdellovibrionales bacterium]